MNIVSSSILSLIIFAFGALKASTPTYDVANGYDTCLTVYTTTTIFEPPQSSTFVYTSTVVVPAEAASVVTKTIKKPESVVIETSTIESSISLTIFTTKTKYYGATTTSISTQTVTTYPNAVTSVTSVERLVVYVKGTLTVTYPPPVVTIDSISRYTGAPTSLWLSVI